MCLNYKTQFTSFHCNSCGHVAKLSLMEWEPLAGVFGGLPIREGGMFLPHFLLLILTEFE